MQVEVKRSEEPGRKTSTISFTSEGKDLLHVLWRMLTERIGLLEACDREIDAAFAAAVAAGKLGQAEADKSSGELKKALRIGLAAARKAMTQVPLHALHIATVEDLKSVEAKVDEMGKRVDALGKPAPTRAARRHRISRPASPRTRRAAAATRAQM